MIAMIPGIDNQFFMKKALVLAQEAAQYEEVPIGAIVVNAQGIVIGTGFNQVEKQQTQTAHAELLAIKAASATLCNWRLTDCWVYVTLEPCLMCMGLIRLSRLAGVVYGASSRLFGYSLDNERSFAVYQNDSFHIISHVMENEAKFLLKEFFEKKRRGGPGG